MDERTDRDSDAVAAETVSRLCYWLIKSNFDIWNSASQASLTKMKESISRSLGHDRSSLLSSKGFSAAAETAACTDLHRQHVCGFVHKSSRRVEIAPRVSSDDLEPLALRESGGGSDRFGIRGDGRLTVLHAHGSAKTLYKTFVCFKWECL